jgi:hypothetical protein
VFSASHIASLRLVLQVKAQNVRMLRWGWELGEESHTFYIRHYNFKYLLPVYLHKAKKFKSLKHKYFANKVFIKC